MANDAISTTPRQNARGRAFSRRATGHTLVGVPIVVVLVLVFATLIALLAGLPWLASRARRRGLGGSPLTPFDEIWHPAAHRAHIDIQVQDERVAPAPAPGDPAETAGTAGTAGGRARVSQAQPARLTRHPPFRTG